MSEHGWTRHGHRCCDQATGPRPPRTARCGGPVLCPECAADAAIRHAPASGQISTPPTSPPDDVYEVAARLLPKIEIPCPDPQCSDSTWDHECRWGSRPNHELAKKLVDGLWPLIHAAGVAAGRDRAAADIRAADVERIERLHGDTVRLGLTVAARIAEGGEPRG